MSIKKNLMVAAAIATIGVGALGVGVANAATSTTSSTSIVDKIATKFGLKKADVQAVFDAEHTEREAAHIEVIADKLAAGVKAGTIAQSQSDAITAKIKELQTTRGANHAKFETMTDSERKSAIDATRTAVKQWITDNKIPEQFARLLHGGNRGHGGMMMGGDMAPPSDSTN